MERVEITLGDIEFTLGDGEETYVLVARFVEGGWLPQLDYWRSPRW